MYAERGSATLAPPSLRYRLGHAATPASHRICPPLGTCDDDRRRAATLSLTHTSVRLAKDAARPGGPDADRYVLDDQAVIVAGLLPPGG